MRIVRHLLLPSACFGLAWLAAYLFTVPAESPEETEATPAPRRVPPRVRASSSGSGWVSVERLEQAFRDRPAGEWAQLWDEFAGRATVAELAEVCQLVDYPVNLGGKRDGRNVPRLLAEEELAQRSDRPPALVPGAYAALAEVDPEAAWKELERNNRSDLAIAVLRTLAARDPEGTLERFRSLPTPVARPWGYSHDAGEGGMSSGSPLGAIFGAWARRDPAAASAAAMRLSPHERNQVAGNVAVTWAYRDGPAAIPFMLPFLKAKQEYADELYRLHEVLRASFLIDPQETARWMARSPVLRSKLDGGRTQHSVLKPWCDADFQGVVAWAIEQEREIEERGDANGTTRWNSRSRAVVDALKDDPEACANFIRELAAGGCRDAAAHHIRSFARVDGPSALALAGELGIEPPSLPPPTSRLPDYDPAAACDLWLEEIGRHDDPDEALAELGWSRRRLTQLCFRAVRSFPDRAAELASRVQVSWFDAGLLRHLTPPEGIDHYWPELARPGPESGAGSSAGRVFPDSQFRLDPASAADSLLAGPYTAQEVKRAIERWAAHDLKAASAWLARVPDAEARREGEGIVLKLRAVRDPEGVLEELLESGELKEGSTPNWVSQCLSRIQWRGGDWKGWRERLPGVARASAGLHRPETEERLLEALGREGR